MERAGSELTAFDETVVFLDYFKDLPDPRQAGKVIYPLAEVLLLCLLAVLAGAETFVDIARFGEKKIDLLRRFRPFRHGTPAHDHLGDILSVLDAAQFQRCFVTWVAALTGAAREVIAIDGKTLRRSGGKKDTQAAVGLSRRDNRLVPLQPLFDSFVEWIARARMWTTIPGNAAARLRRAWVVWSIVLDDPTTALSDLGGHKGAQMASELGVRPFFVHACQPAVSGHIGRQYGCEPSFCVLGGQGSVLSDPMEQAQVRSNIGTR